MKKLERFILILMSVIFVYTSCTKEIMPYAPEVITNKITNIHGTSATFSGKVIFDGVTKELVLASDDDMAYEGKSSLTHRGFVYSLSSDNPDPTIGAEGVIIEELALGTGIGVYTGDIIGLTITTQYSVRAYATNFVGTTYGNVENFTTTAAAPNVITNPTTNIKTKTATLNGDVADDGGSIVIERGFVYSTINTNPSLDGYNTMKVTYAILGKGTFIYNLTGLSVSTTYYVRSYAINSIGTSYGGVEIFATTSVSPSVTTNAATSVEPRAATLNGDVTDEGGDSVNERGFVYSILNAIPSIDGPSTIKIPSGTFGKGVFSYNLTEIAVFTTYYVRSYATNSVGTSYGEVVSFTTPAVVPSVTTNITTDVKATTVTLNGDVTDEGGAAIQEQGFVYSIINVTPLIDGLNTTKIISETSGEGAYTYNLTGLTIATTYYVRSYAINPAGTSYGDVKSFSTIPYVEGSYLGYGVKMGDNWWAPVNVGATTPTAGGNYYQWGNKTEGWFFLWSINNTAWNIGSEESPVKNTANAPCPDGWRVPTNTEYKALESSSIITYHGDWNIDSAGIIRFTSKATGNYIEFLAAGYLHNRNGDLLNVGDSGYYCSSSLYDASSNTYHLHFTNDFINPSNGHFRTNGFSMRCIEE